MKKLIFAFILILLLLIPSAAFADGGFSYSFENESDALLWYGGLYDESIPFEKGFSMYVQSPFGELKGDTCTHVLDYSPTVHLEQGKVYTVSGYVMNPLSPYSPSVRSVASLSPGENTIIVSVSGIGDEWGKFSTTFYVGESRDYNLSFHFAEGYVDFGFFVDEISLSERNCTISSLILSGPEEILIPASASVENGYFPYLTTADSEIISILPSTSLHFSHTQAAGVSFNASKYTLNVGADAVTGTNITISCSLKNNPSLPPARLTVSLTDNMIDNGSFDSENYLWDSSSGIDYINSADEKYLSVPTNDYGDFGYFTTLNYDTPQLLLEGVVYVMHARVKSDSTMPFSTIYAKNTSEHKNNTVYFNIKNISGNEWINVFAAFVPDKTGIYDIALNLCSMYDCTIYIDDIRFSSEVIKPQYITLHAPGNIMIPGVTTSYPVSALLRDQLGNILPSEDITISLLEEGSSVYLDNSSKTITVNPDSLSGTYTLVATYNPDPSVTAKLDIVLSFDYIGDGKFEKTVPNEWWMVSSPFEYDFYIRHDGFTKSALINSKGPYFMFLNNSYVHLFEGVPYVLNSGFSAGIDCTAVLFIETLNSEMIPLAQVNIPAGATLNESQPPVLFLSEGDYVGRLFFYIQSAEGEPFTIYLDNLSLKNATILASNAQIVGTTYVNGTASAEFVLFNNIAESADTSACAITWYMSDNPYRGFSEVVSNGKNIYFDTTFLNKYVYFEVVPICPVTGFSGNVIRSMPVFISFDPSDNSLSLPLFTPTVIKGKPSGESYFEDVRGHWGESYINILKESGIISGKSAYVFAPDDTVTRAEFAKMLSLAFSIKLDANYSSLMDINKTDWFYSYAVSLNLAGIINGTSPSSFSPYMSLSRESAAAMLVRIYEKTRGNYNPVNKISFTDNESISSWAENDVIKAASMGIIQGNPDGAFNPQGSITRAEASAIIYRLARIL